MNTNICATLKDKDCVENTTCSWLSLVNKNGEPSGHACITKKTAGKTEGRKKALITGTIKNEYTKEAKKEISEWNKAHNISESSESSKSSKSNFSKVKNVTKFLGEVASSVAEGVAQSNAINNLGNVASSLASNKYENNYKDKYLKYKKKYLELKRELELKNN